MSKIKEILKKNPTIYALNEKYQKIKFNAISQLSSISPDLVTKIRYKNVFFKKLDIDNPQNYNEKIIWLKARKYANDPLVTQCADKYAVREYVEKCGLGHIINDLIGVWDRAEDINWDELPNQFAIKCNHGCGYNIVCHDKAVFDIKKATKQLDKWMHTEYWKEYAEVHYKAMPKKIICEKYLGKGEALPGDYKIYCFNGEPEYIGNYVERNMAEDTFLRGYFDIDWNPIDILTFEQDTEAFQRPATLETMLEYARILSKPFPMVRVDFYEVDGKIYLGELTFTPAGGMANYYTEEAQKKYGDMIPME